MNNFTRKLILIIIGILLIIIGLFLTFGILVSSLKEGDDFYGFFISFGLIGVGIFCLTRGIKIKKKFND